MLFSDKIELFIPPKKGKNHSLRIIRELLAHKPESKGTDIGLCLNRLNKLSKKNAIAILVSDFNDTDFDKPFKLCSKKHDLIPVVVEDVIERKLPSINAFMEVEDGEKGVSYTVNLASSPLHKYFKNCVINKKRHLKRLFSATNVEPIYIKSEEDIIDPIVKFFKRRERKFR